MTHYIQFGIAHAVPLVIAFVAIAVLLALIPTGPNGPPDPIAKPLLTAREAAMLHALEAALPMFRIYPQVAMGALLTIPRVPGRRFTPADRNAFSQKIIDFVVFDPTIGKIVALIECDDRTHRAEKDAARDAMTARAGYQTIRIPGSARPTVQTAIAAIWHLREDAQASA